jgi:pimeloyl-ACP methyl ester carboxylesterase
LGGGPIGLWWATAHPDRVRSLFILNTLAHRPRRQVDISLPLRLFRTPGVGEVMVKGLDLFKRVFLFRAGVVHHERLTSEIKHAYRTPHPNWSSRTPILEFPREIPSGPEGPVSDLGGEIEARLERGFRSKPVKIVWPMKDRAFTPYYLDELWLATFPDADVTRIEDAGHYIQEDAHERVVPELLDFLASR